MFSTVLDLSSATSDAQKRSFLSPTPRWQCSYSSQVHPMQFRICHAGAPTRYSPQCLVHPDIFLDDSCILEILNNLFSVVSKLSFFEWDPNYIFYFLGAFYLLLYDSLRVNCFHFSGYYQRYLRILYIAFDEIFSYSTGKSRSHVRMLQAHSF